jgi:thioredoxin-like negative regulator of GroEL
MKNFVLIVCLFCCLITITAQKKSGVRLIDLDSTGFINNIWDFRTTDEFVFKGKKPAIIHFYDPANSQSRVLFSVLEDIQKEFRNKIDIYLINKEKQLELVQLFQIRNFPTLLFVSSQGNPATYVGFKTKDEIKSLLESFVLTR